MQQVQKGFTLIELMIVVAIIGILAAVAVPAYQNYTIKARYTEVVNAAAPFKTAIELCINNGPCNVAGAVNVPATGAARAASGVGVPNDIAAASGIVGTVVVTPGTGAITVTPVAGNGIVIGDTYVLTPTITALTGGITWLRTGGCSTRAAGPIC